MNKQEVYDYLKEHHIWHEITEHRAVYSMEELPGVALPYPDYDAKNLFVRDDKKKHYYMITVRGNKRVDLKAFRKSNGTRPLSFASAEDMMELLALVPGSVSPFGLLNDAACRVTLFLDRDFLDGLGLIGIHPNENTATVWLKTNDLIEQIRAHGTTVNVVQMIEKTK